MVGKRIAALAVPTFRKNSMAIANPRDPIRFSPRRLALLPLQPDYPRSDVAKDIAVPAVTAFVALQLNLGAAFAQGVSGRLGDADRNEILRRMQKIVGAAFGTSQIG